MRSSFNFLQEAYYNRLNGAINQGGIIPVYDRVPDKANAPYIILSSMEATSQGTKDSYGQIVTVLIDCVTAYDGNFGGKKLVNNIANSVLELCITRPDGDFDLCDDNFQVVTTDLESDVTLDELFNTRYIVRRLIRIRHFVTQLNN